MIASAPRPQAPAFRVHGHDPERVHVYTDAAGQPLGACVRFAPGTLEDDRKTFRAFRHEGGAWSIGLNGIRLPLYNLPRLLTAVKHGELVFFVEGEQCVESLDGIDVAATTNPGGAGKWDESYSDPLRGADVVILPDNDAIGRKHAAAVAEALHGVARSARVLELEPLPERGDVVDWLGAGGTRQALLAQVDATPLWSRGAAQTNEWSDPVPFGPPSEPEPFPVLEALPPELAKLVTAIADSVKVDVAAPAALIPVVLSVAAGNAYRIRVSRSYAEPALARFGVEALDSGERKSALFRLVVRPLDAWVERRRSDYKRLKDQADSAAIFQRKRAEHAEAQGAKEKNASQAEQWCAAAVEARGMIPSPPRRPLVYIGDTTSEFLARHMNEQGGAFGVLAADARQVVDTLLGRYRKDGGTDDAVYLRAHGGDQIDRGRVGADATGELICIPRPSLAVGICIQPDKLAELAARPELLASGFLARCNIIRPRSLVGERFETGDELPLDPECADQWKLTVGTLIDDRFRIVDSASDYAWQPVELVLDEEAMVLRREFHNEIEARQAAGGDLYAFRSFASKAAGEAARLAGLFHLHELARSNRLSNAGCIPVPATTWRSAEAHQRWALTETVRNVVLLREDDDTRRARRLLEWVARDPAARAVLTQRLLVTARIADSADDAARLLDWLAQRGWTRQIEPEGKQRTSRWSVHPAALHGDGR